MRKNFLILFSLLAISTSISPRTYTNKTFLMPRPVLENMAMEYTTWHTQVDKDKLKWGGSLQATGFYQKSTNKANIGDYFGFYWDDEDRIVDYINIVTKTDEQPDGIDQYFITHDYLMQEEVILPTGKIKFEPNQESYGLRLDYYQAWKRWFLKISTPIVKVKTDLNRFSDNLSYMYGADPSTNGKTLYDVLSGNFQNTDETNLQECLKYAKIGGAQDEAGLGDIAVTIGYNIYKKNDNYVRFGAEVTIPTSNSATGEYLFEPIYGNGDYWALGGTFDAKATLWDEKDAAIQFLVGLRLKYLFEQTEKRTLGFTKYDNTDSCPKDNLYDFGHYYLGGQNGKNALFPLANVLTRDVKVNPHLHFEGLLGLALISGNFTLDIGYNIFAKEGEDLSLKDCWKDDTYAVAKIGFKTTDVFDITNPAHVHLKINNSNLNLNVAATPTQITHKVYLGAGYAFNQRKHPIMLGLGTSYEFISANTALENFAVWGKVGISF